MIVENTKENQIISNVASSMAIEDMYFDKEFINEMIDVSQGKKSADDVIKEIIAEYSGK